VSARNLVFGSVVVAIFSIPGTANAQCAAPTLIDAQIGINISKTQFRASAPGYAVLMDNNGAECFGWALDGTIKIVQHNPEVEFVVSGSGTGHWIYTLDAPAQPGSCYNSTITATGGYRLTPVRDDDAAGPVCWNRDDIPMPGRQPRNCEPIWDVDGEVWLDPECNTPILLNPGTGTYQFTSAANGVRFDIRADGSPRLVAWTLPDSDVAFLALDRNANGAIDDGAELFGSATTLASGVRARHGFEALAELDGNGDGVLSPLDPKWMSLLLWTDRDHNGASAPGELQRLPDSRLAWLAAGSQDRANRQDEWGNLFRYMSRAGMRVSATENVRQIVYYDVFLTSE
jgi:hypothetical protein